MGILILLAQCVAMFLASFLAGSLPLMFRSAMSGPSPPSSSIHFQISQLTVRLVLGKRLKVISVFGMGLLVGAALTIIIPECALSHMT